MPSNVSNTLYYGDNLDILRRYLDDESVDLIYLDPPFNSNADYNVLFAEKDGTQAHAQIKAFKDTWTWDMEAAQEYAEILRSGHDRIAKCTKSLHDLLGGSDMMAYLSMMAIRLIELRRVLKPAGSIYLHCDPTASHYLKIILDSIFAPENFLSEIVWRRTASHNSAKRFAPIHDIIFLYSKSDETKWNRPKRPYMLKHVTDNFVQEGDRWKTAYYGNVLTGSGTRNGESGAEWRGFNPTAKGRHWAIPGKLVEQVEEEIGESLANLSPLEKLERLYQLGAITIKEGMAWPEYALCIDPAHGQPVADIWSFQPYTNGLVYGTQDGIDEDVRWLNPRDRERLGYPTQKPLGLLERIISASSNENDLVLDPFCGCGTTIAAAQKLNRRWIGIDITHLAINLIKVRLADTFGTKIAESYNVIGEPEDLQGARALAEQDKYQFQYWALGLVGARPMEEKKGADKGIDGRLYMTDSAGETKSIIISVKGGHVTSAQIRDLRGVIEREEAAIGVFITLEEPTAPMRKEAAEAGFFQTKSVSATKHARLQLLTIEDLLGGKKIDMPAAQDLRSFKQAPKAKSKKRSDPNLPFAE